MDKNKAMHLQAILQIFQEVSMEVLRVAVLYLKASTKGARHVM